MPKFDGTGPAGAGKATGRGFGPCGDGTGQRKGFGRGLGRFSGGRNLPQAKGGSLADYKKTLEEKLENVKKELSKKD